MTIVPAEKRLHSCDHAANNKGSGSLLIPLPSSILNHLGLSFVEKHLRLPSDSRFLSLKTLTHTAQRSVRLRYGSKVSTRSAPELQSQTPNTAHRPSLPILLPHKTNRLAEFEATTPPSRTATKLQHTYGTVRISQHCRRHRRRYTPLNIERKFGPSLATPAAVRAATAPQNPPFGNLLHLRRR